MGWSIGFDSSHSRDIGYGVPAVCDHPECDKRIDRGLDHVCANQEPYGGEGCGLYFCGEHKGFYREVDWNGEGEEPEPEISDCCERCRDGLDPFPAKPDLPIWTKFKMTDKSWRGWRKENGFPEPTPAMIAEIIAYEKSL
jgi:hypothetical protein